MNLVDNELICAFLEAFTKNNHFLLSTSWTFSYVPTLKPAFDVVLASIITLILVLTPTVPSTDVNLFQQSMKAFLTAQI